MRLSVDQEFLIIPNNPQETFNYLIGFGAFLDGSNRNSTIFLSVDVDYLNHILNQHSILG